MRIVNLRLPALSLYLTSRKIKFSPPSKQEVYGYIFRVRGRKGMTNDITPLLKQTLPGPDLRPCFPFLDAYFMHPAGGVGYIFYWVILRVCEFRSYEISRFRKRYLLDSFQHLHILGSSK